MCLTLFTGCQIPEVCGADTKAIPIGIFPGRLPEVESIHINVAALGTKAQESLLVFYGLKLTLALKRTLQRRLILIRTDAVV
jgi:hypothetical protein